MAIEQPWETLKHAIFSYTGLSPAAFFTALAVALAFYYVVSGFFSSAPPPANNPREFQMEPVQVGEITKEELKQYDGSDPMKPLLMSIKGQIYDVSQSRNFYGPGGSYALFAGKDASRALAKLSFEEKDLTDDISGLGPFELDALQDWEYKFMSKYVKVGTIKKPESVDESNATTSAATEPIAQNATDSHSVSREVGSPDNDVSGPSEEIINSNDGSADPTGEVGGHGFHGSAEQQMLRVEPVEPIHANDVAVSKDQV